MRVYVLAGFNEGLVMIGEKALDTVSEDIKENISLTLVESDIFTHQFLNKGSPIYNLGFRSVLTGDIDVELLVKTYINTVRSYKTLCFGFNVDDSHSYKDRVELLQPVFDIRPSWPEKDEWIEWLRKPFDLTTPPLLRCIFSPVNDSECHLYFSFHHLAFDGAGFQRFYTDFIHHYCHSLSGDDYHIPSLNEHFSDEMLNDLEYIGSHRWEKDRLYWQQRLTDGRKSIIPLAESDGDMTYRIEKLMPDNVWNSIEIFSKTLGCSPHYVVLLAIELCCHAYGNKSLTMGLPTHRRSHGVSTFCGLTTGISPLVIDIDVTLSMSESIKNLSSCIKRDYRHLRFPISEIKKSMTGLDAHRPVYDIMFSYEPLDFDLKNNAVENQISALCHHAEMTPICIYLRHYHSAASPILDCQFNPGYFTFEDGVLWVDRLIHIIKNMLSSPDIPLKEVCLLTESEKSLYRTINNNYKPNSSPLISNIYHHSITNPSKMAIITEDGDCHTYNELWCLVLERVGVFNQLGVKKGNNIVLALPRGIEFIVNLLAANYLGATYVPIQENIPSVRLYALLKKVNANMLVSDRKLDLAPELSINVYTPSDLCSINPESVSLKKIGIEKGNYIAYVLFTSGSTGEPKGVLINSAARDSFLEGCCNTVSLRRESIIIAATAPTFDISVLELLGPLYVGGSCVIANEITKRQGHLLAALIAKCNVTHVQGTPTTWKLLLQAGWTPPNKITALVGGEPLPQDVALSLSNRCGLVFNMYGPTEATVWVMAKPVAGEETVESIGNLLQNCEAYVLDSDLRILPPGVEGELALAGCCLSDGYCGATELTASRFPYHPMGKRIYLTGDRVKLNTGSQFKFIGRTDNQIKRRGFRIELGDIESSCTMHPMVQHVAAVLAVGNEGEEKKIVLLYQGDISEAHFMTWIKEQLTDYMYPDFLQKCSSWPVNGSDKTDRTKLMGLIDLNMAKPWGCIDIEIHVPPSESVDLEVVERLHTLWKSILKLDVNITANFLDCGGSSLQAQILLDKIRRNFPSSIPDTFIFICPSITAQAQFLNKAKLPANARTQDGNKNHIRNNLLGKRRVVLEGK